MMNKFPVAKNLNDSKYRLLLQVYANHNRSMGMEARKSFMLSDIVKVEEGVKGCLKVYYSNGDWWHYAPDGTWY